MGGGFLHLHGWIHADRAPALAGRPAPCHTQGRSPGRRTRILAFRNLIMRSVMLPGAERMLPMRSVIFLQHGCSRESIWKMIAAQPRS